MSDPFKRGINKLHGKTEWSLKYVHAKNLCEFLFPVAVKPYCHIYRTRINQTIVLDYPRKKHPKIC